MPLEGVEADNFTGPVFLALTSKNFALRRWGIASHGEHPPGVVIIIDALLVPHATHAAVASPGLAVTTDPIIGGEECTLRR